MLPEDQKQQIERHLKIIYLQVYSLNALVKYEWVLLHMRIRDGRRSVKKAAAYLFLLTLIELYLDLFKKYNFVDSLEMRENMCVADDLEVITFKDQVSEVKDFARYTYKLLLDAYRDLTISIRESKMEEQYSDMNYFDFLEEAMQAMSSILAIRDAAYFEFHVKTMGLENYSTIFIHN